MTSMKRLRSAFAAGLLFFSAGSMAAAPGASIWNDIVEQDIPRNEQARDIVPERYRTVRLNRGTLMSALAKAPPEQSQRPRASKATLDLPMPGGGTETFRIVDSPIMEPALAAKFPAIRTFLGESISDPATSVRFDVTPKGFHAQILSPEGTIYIDPFQRGDQDHYIAYRKRDHDHGEEIVCGVTGDSVTSGMDVTSKRAMSKLSSGASLRTFRLAMAATGEYTAYHGGTVMDGLSAVVTTMNRVNGIYEREVSVRMVLVANNDQIIYTNAASDPYSNTAPSTLLTENVSNLNAVIGSGSYDVGHVVGTGGGGLAGLGVICSSGKARGETGSPTPVGDAFDVDYVAHELGHQF
ncbi:MAG TPA: zinc-dependent metalloprotease family protein, partial [Patescibacteria group bacterium]|nr:zinc-dependent metalloprotease family protein [Patescibacteria group bacterium]